jgi:hypothetical protein
MSDDWNTYRIRSLIRAKRLTEYVSFTDPLGRTHSGDPGDYLVQSPDGQLRITPRQVFEDVYVILERQEPEFSSRSDNKAQPSLRRA